MATFTDLVGGSIVDGRSSNNLNRHPAQLILTETEYETLENNTMIDPDGNITGPVNPALPFLDTETLYYIAEDV